MTTSLFSVTAKINPKMINEIQNIFLVCKKEKKNTEQGVKVTEIQIQHRFITEPC